MIDYKVLYEKQRLLRKHKEEQGQLICDKLKLQEDLIINVASDQIVGVTKDFISQKKILKNLLDKEKPNLMHKSATYINQWRYRSSDGRSYNCKFWYNSGSLDGDALLEYFIQVVLRCEFVGSRVRGLCTMQEGIMLAY